MTAVELLAPARDAAHGKAAIIHGADAVYIGAPQFSARADAAAHLKDIESLTRFAHLYRAKVYAAVNTILYDSEIDEALRLIRQLYEIGVDALIVQDMGLLQCDLPPIPLFASTQTHNHTVERVQFLEKAGFKRVILARELSLPEIRAIRTATTLELECFVHGALCVSYSGQCYLSHAATGRSGNRGTCAQLCRASYQLLDGEGKQLIENAYLLSLKDLNLSAYLLDLLQSGVTSFKIEGRLKDLCYVKNVTAFYRQRLDVLLEGRPFRRSSSGKTLLHFIPDLEKTFNRGYTNYFIATTDSKPASPATPKSTGQRIGRVVEVSRRWFRIDTPHTISNGDGLCWLSSSHSLEGVQVNSVEGGKIFPAKPVTIAIGTEVFRNNDFQFEKQLKGASAERFIEVDFQISATDTGFILEAKDEDGCRACMQMSVEKIPAKDTARSGQQIVVQLQKLGGTSFTAGRITVPPDFTWFIPAATLNELRRGVIRQLEEVRIEHFRAKEEPRHAEDASFPASTVDYRGNVANRHARAFYERHGTRVVESAFELLKEHRGKPLMTCKYCIRRQYDACLRDRSGKKWKGPLSLRNGGRNYHLSFDCGACVMTISE